MSIDLFFTSLAEVHQKQAIGVVLSGTGKDGTEALRAIKERGGVTFRNNNKQLTIQKCHNMLSTRVLLISASTK